MTFAWRSIGEAVILKTSEALSRRQKSGSAYTMRKPTARWSNRQDWCSKIWFAGETFVHWPGRSFDFAESRLHALRSLEINPRWSDTNYLAKHKALQPAIFEPLVIGAVTALTTRTLGRVVANLGWTGIEMPRPVRPGETIYAESTIIDVRELAFASDAGYRAGRNACLRRRRRTGLPLSACLADLSPQRRALRGCRLLKQQNLI